MAGYLDILRPNIFTEVVKQVVASADPILPFMGFQPGGPNEKYYGHGREGMYHVLDDTRKVAKSRAPGMPAARSDKQPMKAIPFVYPRLHDSVSLLAEFYHNLAKIDDPTVRDEAGRSMIMMQTDVLLKKAANWRIALTVGMLRNGAVYMHEEGDDWYINYTSSGARFTIDFGIPAGNKTQLNMTYRDGTTSINGASALDVAWTSPGANIPSQFASINSARAAVGTGPVRHALLNSITWQYLLANEYLMAQAGISNPPFTTYERVVGTRQDGSPLHEYVGAFNALPGILWHITDEGLDLWNASSDVFEFVKHFPDGVVVFMGDPISSNKYKIYQGSEPIAEYDGGPETVRVGLSSWSKKTANPTATEVYVLDNALPVPQDPYDIQVATVSGF